MGGVIAQRFALDHPPRVRSLVLVSTSSEIGGARPAPTGSASPTRIEQRGFGSGARDASRAFAPGFAAAHPDIVAARRRADRAQRPRRLRGGGARHERLPLDRRPRSGPAVPVLILQGLADQLTPPGGSVKMHRALPASRLLMLPDTGHSLPIEQPTPFTAALLGFTGGVDGCALLA